MSVQAKHQPAKGRRDPTTPCSFKLVILFLASFLVGLSFFFGNNIQETMKYYLVEEPNLSPTPLLHQVAPLLFAMDPDTNTIRFAKSVKTVIIDIGARMPNAYLEKLKTTHADDNTVGLILVDAQRDSIVPLQQKVAEFNMRENNLDGHGWTLDDKYQHFVYALHAALSQNETIANFHHARMPACSSLLESSKKSEWCGRQDRSKYKQDERVMVFTLKDLVALIPESIKLHLRVDTEGSELMVLRGADRDTMDRFETIVIECMSDEARQTKTFYEDGCVEGEALRYMCAEHGRCRHEFLLDRGGTNGSVFWAKSRRTKIPKFLAQLRGREWHNFYRTNKNNNVRAGRLAPPPPKKTTNNNNLEGNKKIPPSLAGALTKNANKNAATAKPERAQTMTSAKPKRIQKVPPTTIQNASKNGNKSTNKAANKTTNKTANKPKNKTTNKTVHKIVNKTANKTAKKSVRKTANQTRNKDGNKNGNEKESRYLESNDIVTKEDDRR